MKNFRNYGLVGLTVILAISLVFLGIDFLQAQVTTKGEPPNKPPGKEKKDEAKWMVTFPNPLSDNLFPLNTDYSTFFTENEFVSVLMSEPSTQCACYRFSLRIYRPADQDLGPWAIGFRNIGISEYTIYDQGTPCVLPGLSDGCLGNSCPSCIADFLNNIPHPSAGYLSVIIQVKLAAEFVDALQEGSRTHMPASCGCLYISMWNGYPVLPPGSTEIYHEVFGFTEIFSDGLNGLYVTKLQGGDKWILEFINHPLDLEENYMGERTYYTGKKEKTGTQFVTPIEVVTTPISFQMTWDRLQ